MNAAPKPTPEPSLTQEQADAYALTGACPSCGASHEHIDQDADMCSHYGIKLVVACECESCGFCFVEAFKLYGVSGLTEDNHIAGHAVRTFDVEPVHRSQPT